MQNGLSDQELSEQLVQVYKNFLLNDDEYSSRIRQIALENTESSRLLVDLKDLRRINEDLPRKVISEPYTYVSPFEDAIRELIDLDRGLNKEGKSMNKVSLSVRVGFTGWFGRHHLTPRGLTANNVNHMVCIEGIISQCSVVRPKLVKSVHISQSSMIGKLDSNGNPVQTYVEIREHRDLSCLFKDRYVQSGIPKEDSYGNKMEVEIGLCKYKDNQKLTLQELPEMIPTGQLPRSVEVIVEDDLVEVVKPGDRVRIVGVYKPLGRKDGNAMTGIFKVVIIANSIQLLNMNVVNPDVSPQEIKAMKEISARSDTFEILSNSFAPSLCGHEYIKKGLLLGILGGAEHNLENGTHIRGDIHTLLIGEPSCGKSQLLRFIMSIAPLAISTTGRGCSGVGLTAAVTYDPDTKERRLEAGATVLADRGIVCIDEFDKMSFADRVAIHEVMEQQRVTIAKAGIQASLNARCSIFAAANPVYGHFDDRMELSRQIAFPDSLLSRFDLIFIVRDVKTSQQDRRIASQVLAQIRYKNCDSSHFSGPNRGMSTVIIQPDLQDDDNIDDEINKIWQTSVFQMFESNIDNINVNIANTSTKHQGRSIDNTITQRILTTSFLRKYIHYCKYVRSTPKLSDEAIELVAKFFSDLRSRCLNQSNGSTTCTTRTLEGIIRLATAHSKLKMQDFVLKEDVQVACELLNYALFGECPDTKCLEQNEEAEEDGDDEDTFDRDNRRNEKKSRRKSDVTFLADDDGSVPAAPPSSSATTPGRIALDPIESAARGRETALAVADLLRKDIDIDIRSSNISGERKQLLISYIAEQFADTGLEAMLLGDLLEQINNKIKNSSHSNQIELSTTEELKEVIYLLESENKLMTVDDTIYSVVS
ncbi:DNA replication licencing factor MCM3 [Cryptosporidium andersoni]|uniref:DNA replication licensing factor MCM3 n=1 Tax=Cryptosporidium andersoni TaxID=117008 RepID=A0A1J4MSE8_9CRYT|nr:DNA replication licencing factor MCM3 [Cryptosporidium andersoni]